MRYLNLLPTFVICVILFASCRTASKMYSKGDYADAYYKAVSSSKTAKTYNKNAVLIANSYSNAVEAIKADLSQVNQSLTENTWARKINLLQKIENLNNAANRNVFVRGQFNLYDVTAQIEDAKTNDQAYKVQHIENLMATNKKSKIVEAYRYSQKAMYDYPTNATLQALSQRAEMLGTTNVVVQVSNPNYNMYNTNNNNNNNIEQMERNLIHSLNQAGKNSLIMYMAANQQNSNNVAPDYVLDVNMQYRDVDIIKSRNQSTEMNKSGVLIREVVIRPDSIVREYGTVRAQFEEHEKYINAKIDVNLSIRKASNYYNDYNRNLTDDYNWNTKTYSYTGDIRALSDSQKQQLDDNPKTAPHKTTVVSALQRDANNSIENEVSQYFRRIN